MVIRCNLDLIVVTQIRKIIGFIFVEGGMANSDRCLVMTDDAVLSAYPSLMSSSVAKSANKANTTPLINKPKSFVI